MNPLKLSEEDKKKWDFYMEIYGYVSVSKNAEGRWVVDPPDVQRRMMKHY